MSATLILPSPATIERCCDLLTEPAGQPAAPRHAAASPGGEAPHGLLDTDDASDTDPQMPALTSTLTLQHTVEATSADGAGIDFFATPAAAVPDGLDDEAASWPGTDSQSGGTDSSRATEEPAVAPSTSASVPAGDDPSYEGLDGAVPEIMPIWNRILGQLDLCPPHSTQQRGPREKRLNELTVFLQHNRFVDADEIIRNVFGGAASEKTVTQQVSMLRARLGVVHAGGPKALPPMRDGSYVLDGAVRSDWMEFERLVEILIDTTPTAHLIAAMDLVTGPPLGGVPPKEWAWTKDIRDEIRDRVAGAAVVLARRHHSAKKFSDAAEIARKGLWYDNARQDLWQIGMQAALDGHDKNGFKTLRSQYLSAVAGPDRDPAVFDLTKHAG